MSGLAFATGIVDTLIRAGIRIAEQREEAIEVLVRNMKPSPEDISSDYWASRDRLLGAADEVLERRDTDKTPPPDELR